MPFRRLSALYEFNKISVFMTADQINQVKSDYILLDKQSLSAADYAKDVKTYPQLANEDIYKINTTDKKEIAALNTIFSHSLPVVANLEQNAAATFAQFGIQYTCRCGPIRSDCTNYRLPNLRRFKVLLGHKSMPLSRTC